MFARLILSALLLAAVSGCGPDYSPNTYATDAVQQASKVDQGVVVGVRQVDISASGTAGAVVGGAAGGVAGSQVGSGAQKALTTLGSTLVGGIAGSAAEHAMNDTSAFEYIVRKPNGDLLSVTQKDTTPLALGQKVLVIAGKQARVVPDYTVDVGAKEKAADASKQASAAAPPPPPVTATPLAPPSDAEIGP
jgi:outer membrane lipoprotein SlyB